MWSSKVENRGGGWSRALIWRMHVAGSFALANGSSSPSARAGKLLAAGFSLFEPCDTKVKAC